MHIIYIEDNVKSISNSNRFSGIQYNFLLSPICGWLMCTLDVVSLTITGHFPFLSSASFNVFLPSNGSKAVPF